MGSFLKLFFGLWLKNGDTLRVGCPHFSAALAQMAARRRARPVLEALEQRTLLSIALPTPGIPGPVTITGTDGPDQFIVGLGAQGQIQFSDDGGATFQTAALADVTRVSVSGLGGDDQLFIDNSNGLVAKPNGLTIAYDGGPGADTLFSQGFPTPSNPTLGITETYTPGPTSDAGAINTNNGAAVQAIKFTHLSGITDTTAARTLTIAADANSNLIQIRNGAVVGGLDTTRVAGIDRHDIDDTVDDSLDPGTLDAFLDETGEGFVRMDFANKTTVTVDAGGGDDFVAVNNSVPATGLSTLNLDGGAGSNLAAKRVVPPGVAVTAVNFVRTDTASQDIFVDELYELRLHRAPSAGELPAWENVLRGRGGVAAVVNGIERSTEARDQLVRNWYVHYLGRQAVNGEEVGWVSQLLRGTSEGDVLSGILASGEFSNRASRLFSTGNPDENFVRALYLLLLNRSASDVEVNGWLNNLSALGRGGVARAFITSAEYRTDLFTAFYRSILNRDPDSGGLNGWVSSGLDLTTVREDFLASAEFVGNG